MNYTEYRFYQDSWYPVGPDLNIPKCNLKKIWPKRNLTAEEILGFYMVYKKNNKFDEYAEATLSGNTLSVQLRQKVNYGTGTDGYVLQGSLYVKAQNSLINISEAYTTKSRDDIYTHMSLVIGMSTSSNPNYDVWTKSSVFRSSYFDRKPHNNHDWEERILPPFTRDKEYHKECLLGVRVMNGLSLNIDTSFEVSQTVNFIKVNGKEFPFKVVLEYDETGAIWYKDLDPNFFNSDEVKPLPKEMLI